MFEWLTVSSLQFVMFGSAKNASIFLLDKKMDDDGNRG